MGAGDGWTTASSNGCGGAPSTRMSIATTMATDWRRGAAWPGGSTTTIPIVRINQIHIQCQQHELYLKLESCNPGGSIKEKNAVPNYDKEKRKLNQAGRN